MVKKRGQTVTIRFKNNKVSSVSGARSALDAAEAAAFGQAFVDRLKAPRTEAESVETARSEGSDEG